MLGDRVISASDYEQGELISSGAYGRVYQAIEKRTGRVVAMKVLQSNPDVEKKGFMKYFLREIQVMSRMTHPATLSLIGYCGMGGGDPIIVMELCPNGSLESVTEAIRKGREVPEWTPTRRSIAVLGMACALNFMHNQGFIHRDLKPANVLLDASWEPRVCDFGRARTAGGVNMTMADGTPQTMAPELLSDDDTYTNKIDVYSFGICLYLFFREANQFEGDIRPVTNHTTFLRRVSTGHRFLRDPRIPPFYWSLITACWNHNPEARPTFAQILEIFRANKEFAFPGTDMEQLALYEAKVFPPVAPVRQFVFGNPETADPCRDCGDPAKPLEKPATPRQQPPPAPPAPPAPPKEEPAKQLKCEVA
jgi:serine/threonine protein kinase